jgi:hypothetical protein
LGGSETHFILFLFRGFDFKKKQRMSKRIRQTNFLRKPLCSGTIEVEVIGNDSHVAKQFGSADAVFEKDASSIDFAIYFRPALTRAEAERVHVNVYYTGRWTTPNNHLFGQSVLPVAVGGSGDGQEILLGEELRYTVLPTHQLKWSRNGQLIEAVYWTLENNLVTHNTQNTLQLELHVEDKPFLKSVFGERVRHLTWFPPDTEPAAHGLAIDPRNMPLCCLAFMCRKKTKLAERRGASSRARPLAPFLEWPCDWDPFQRTLHCSYICHTTRNKHFMRLAGVRRLLVIQWDGARLLMASWWIQT